MANEKPFSPESIKGTGNVGSDPKRISKANKMNVVVISVAANYKAYDSDQNIFEETVWRDIKVFGRDADAALSSIKKGDRIKYEGRLVPNLYVNKQGEEVINWNVDAEPNGVTLVPRDEENSGGGTRRSGSTTRRRSADVEPEEDFEDDYDDEPEEKPRRSRTSSKPTRSRRKASKNVDDEVDEDIDLEDENPKKRTTRTRRTRAAEVDDDVNDWTESVI